MAENIDDEFLSEDQVEDLLEKQQEESTEEIEVEIVEEVQIEEKKKEFIPSYWNKKYTYAELNAMDSIELNDLLDDKVTAVNTKALIIQVLAGRGIYVD